MLRIISFACTALCLSAVSASVSAQTFPSSSDKVPAGWKGPVFKLSQDYPKSLPPEEVLPWASIDFSTEPQKYVNALYQYALQGNVDVNGWSKTILFASGITRRGCTTEQVGASSFTE